MIGLDQLSTEDLIRLVQARMVRSGVRVDAADYYWRQPPVTARPNALAWLGPSGTVALSDDIVISHINSLPPSGADKPSKETKR